MTDLPYTYKDSGGSELRIGRGYCTASDRTNHKTVSVNAPTGEDAAEFARAVLSAAGDTGHTVISDEKLARLLRAADDRDRYRYRWAADVSSMRERAAEAVDENSATEDYARATALADRLRALPLLPDDEGPVEPQDEAPRDTELIQQVCALVKRYGAPWVAYEAARQARP